MRDTVSACNNVAVLCWVILSVPVTMRQCSVALNYQRLYQCGSALLYVTVFACTSAALFCCVILSVLVPVWQCSVVVIMWVPVPIWRCSVVVWYCQCLYQCGSVLLCDTVSACNNVAVLCCVILSVPVTMWLCSVGSHCHSLYQWWQYSVVWYCQCL
jgi:hypothetical protein